MTSSDLPKELGLAERRPPLRLRWIVGGAACLVLLGLPFVTGGYLLSLATLILYSAYVGQAWNVMMGFAGQLSLGHALYIGLGAYAAAGLFQFFGIGPWAGVWVAIALCAAVAGVIGMLAFRLRIAGVHLALLTIAFAEFVRIGFDHMDWCGGPAGLFLKISRRDHVDLANFQGPPAMYYLAALILAGGALALCWWLSRGRAGHYWRAIREDENAAQSLGINAFRWKLLAMLVSAGMTGVAGVFLAFYYNSLFPEQVFSVTRSIEIILGPVIGGLGTLFGPIVGAVVLVLLGDGATELLSRFGLDVPGLKQIVYGVMLLAVVLYLPNGIWPPLARLLRLDSERT